MSILEEMKKVKNLYVCQPVSLETTTTNRATGKYVPNLTLQSLFI